MFGFSDELFAELDRSERLLGEIDELTKLKQQEVRIRKVTFTVGTLMPYFVLSIVRFEPWQIQLTADRLALLVDCRTTLREVDRGFEPWPDQHSGPLYN